MFKKNNKLTKLPNELKELIIRGVYSLYKVDNPSDKFEFIIVKSDNDAILSNYSGSKKKYITNYENVQFTLIQMLDEKIEIPDSVTVDNRF